MATKIMVTGTSSREKFCRDFGISEKNPVTCGDYIALMWYKDEIGQTFLVEKDLGGVYMVSGAPSYAIATIDSEDAKVVEQV
jgi:hypothetical protein